MKSTILLRKQLNISLKTANKSCLYLEYVELKSEKELLFLCTEGQRAFYLSKHTHQINYKDIDWWAKENYKSKPAQFQVVL
jgi:hypothetical protein